MTSKSFAALLDAAQEKKFPGLADAAVAEQIGVSRQLYWSYKNEIAEPTLGNLILLVRSLEIDPADIFQVSVKKT